MDEFKDRLKYLRLSRNLDTSDIANVLDVTERLIQLYEKGERKPPIENLIKLAKFFEVSTDFLLGLDGKKDIKRMDFF